jgi:hypothetical protein
MPGPSVPFLGEVSVAGTYDVAELENLIQRAGSAVVAQAGTFYLEPAALAGLAAGEVELIKAAVARANAEGAATVRTAALDPAALADAINRGTKAVGGAADLAGHIKTLVEGVAATVKWWGVTLELSRSSAEALERVAGPDLSAILGIVALVFPPAASVNLVIGACGAGLAGWIRAANGPDGVRIGLYFWVVPWVSRR